MRRLAVVLILASCSRSATPTTPTAPISNQAQPEPQIERQPDVEQDSTVGILGSSACRYAEGCAGAFVSLTDAGDTSGVVDGSVAPVASQSGVAEPCADPDPCGGRRPAPGSLVPRVRIGQPTSDPGLDKEIIGRYIRRNKQKILYCYEKWLLADDTLIGTLITNVTIGADGKVTRATASGLHADVASCVVKVIELIEFPKPTSGAAVNVVYPFTFEPTGG